MAPITVRTLVDGGHGAAGPILGTLDELLAEGREDLAGVCDATQVAQVFERRYPRVDPPDDL
jgi:hypothetical protein